jgi:hypothetical protein
MAGDIIPESWATSPGIGNEWAATHDLPRSKAIQALVLRGLAWDELRQRQQQLAA